MRDLDNTNTLLYKLYVRYLVVKPTCINAALVIGLQQIVFRYNASLQHSHRIALA